MNEAFYNQDYYVSHYKNFLGMDSFYQLKSLFWKKAITSLWPVADECVLLDYGCGLGQVSAAFPRAQYYDVSPFSREFLGRHGKTVYSSEQDIPVNSFDVILSSHSLEHSSTPLDDLKFFSTLVKSDGNLILILPIDTNSKRQLEVDVDNHLFS